MELSNHSFGAIHITTAKVKIMANSCKIPYLQGPPLQTYDLNLLFSQYCSKWSELFFSLDLETTTPWRKFSAGNAVHWNFGLNSISTSWAPRYSFPIQTSQWYRHLSEKFKQEWLLSFHQKTTKCYNFRRNLVTSIPSNFTSRRALHIFCVAVQKWF